MWICVFLRRVVRAHVFGVLEYARVCLNWKQPSFVYDRGIPPLMQASKGKTEHFVLRKPAEL